MTFWSHKSSARVAWNSPAIAWIVPQSPNCNNSQYVMPCYWLVMTRQFSCFRSFSESIRFCVVLNFKLNNESNSNSFCQPATERLWRGIKTKSFNTGVGMYKIHLETCRQTHCIRYQSCLLRLLDLHSSTTLPFSHGRSSCLAASARWFPTQKLNNCWRLWWRYYNVQGCVSWYTVILIHYR